MKATVLIEDTTCREDLFSQHGIAVYLETDGPTVLFDMAYNEKMVQNSKTLGKNLSAVDFAVISHGHDDHGGGAAAFCSVNASAPIYLHSRAVTDTHYTKKPETGAPYRSADFSSEGFDERFRFVEGKAESGSTAYRLPDWEGMTFLYHFSKEGMIPEGNKNLFVRQAGGEGGMYETDTFIHETALLVEREEKTLLLTGCSHSGIGNMVYDARKVAQAGKIDVVIGGFHLITSGMQSAGSRDQVEKLVSELSAYPQTKFYTGHCTGAASYKILKELMGDQIESISSGTVITL